MRKLWISLLIAGAVSPVFASFNATVNAADVEIYKKEDLQQVIGLLSAGMVVSVERERNDLCLVNFERMKGWVKKSVLTYFPNRFANVSGGLELCETIFPENNGEYVYFTLNGKLRRMNLQSQIVEDLQNVGEVSDIYPSCLPNLFLFEGVYTNQQEIHQLKLFDTKTGKEVLIGCFDGDKIHITGANFSLNAKKLAVMMLIDGNSYIAVYAADTGKMLFYAENAQWAYWFDPVLVFNDNRNFWSINSDERFNSYDAGYQDNRKLMAIDRSWIVEGRVEARLLGSLLYIETSGATQVFDMDSRQIRSTPFRSLDFDATGTYNYYFNNDLPVLKNVTSGATFSDFSGDPPKKEFIRFAGNRIVYQAVQDRIEALFLYDPASQQTYKYKIIDDIGAIDEDGVAVEVVEDNGLDMIAVEIPDEQRFYIHFLRGDD